MQICLYACASYAQNYTSKQLRDFADADADVGARADADVGARAAAAGARHLYFQYFSY